MRPSMQRPPGGAGRRNVGDVERWASAIGGGAMALSGALYGVARGSPVLAAAAVAAGGSLIYRGLSGRCIVYRALGVDTAQRDGAGKPVEEAVTIEAPAAELYRFWRSFENLPRFMTHLESVTTSGDKRSHWVAKAPMGTTVEWDAEITEERENELIAWRSLPGGDVDSSGSVRFSSAPGGRGTIVRVALEYAPPGGAAGAAVAKLFGEEPSQQIEDDLRRFKQLMEAGEIPTTEGQPAAR